MPSAAYDAAISGLRSADEQSRLGNNPAALKAALFAQTQLPQMTPAEQAEMLPRIARARAEATRPKSAAEVAKGQQDFNARVAQQRHVVNRENEITGGKDPGGQWWNPASWAYDDATIQNQTYTYGGTGSGGAQAPVGGTPGFFDTLARKTASALPESWTGVRNPDPNSFGNQFRDLANKAILVVAVVGGGYVLVTLLGYMTAAKRVQMSSNPRRRRRR